MNKDIDESSLEELIILGRVFSDKTKTWLPALKDIQSHDINPAWVAGVMYLFFDRYISCISDKDQLDFEQKSLFLFNKMLELRRENIERVREE